jgi:hypothetical protein
LGAVRTSSAENTLVAATKARMRAGSAASSTWRKRIRPVLDASAISR